MTAPSPKLKFPFAKLVRSHISNRGQSTFFFLFTPARGLQPSSLHTQNSPLLILTAREEQKRLNKLPNLLYRETKLNGENVFYISPQISSVILSQAL